MRSSGAQSHHRVLPQSCQDCVLPRPAEIPWNLGPFCMCMWHAASTFVWHQLNHGEPWWGKRAEHPCLWQSLSNTACGGFNVVWQANQGKCFEVFWSPFRELKETEPSPFYFSISERLLQKLKGNVYFRRAAFFLSSSLWVSLSYIALPSCKHTEKERKIKGKKF